MVTGVPAEIEAGAGVIVEIVGVRPVCTQASNDGLETPPLDHGASSPQWVNRAIVRIVPAMSRKRSMGTGYLARRVASRLDKFGGDQDAFFFQGFA